MSDNEKNIKITVLGSGTSSGIPTISCECATCTSIDPRDKRLRCSLLVESESSTVVIDTSPDFRQQMLKSNVKKLDGIVFTHHHFDHIGGFDDIRAFNYTSRKPVPLYLTDETYQHLKRTFIYAFEQPDQIGGGVPMVDLNFIDSADFAVADISFKPIQLMHGKLKTLGFRIGNFAYCTDTNHIPENSLLMLENLDILILDALRYDKHTTHYNLEEAIELVNKIKPKTTYLIHMAHEIKHSECEAMLPENVFLAYDGLKFEV